MTAPVPLASDGATLLSAVAVWLAVPASAEWRCHRLNRPRAAGTVPREPAGDPGSSRVAALLDLLAAALDAGLAPPSALAALVPVLAGAEQARLRRAVSMLDVGGDSATVWQLLAPDPTLGPLAKALERSERSGAPVAASVRSLADECRRDDRAARLAAARRVGIRTAVPLGACFLPAFFLIAIVPTVIALLGTVF
jgi:pilus assembly protein TadC